ncbi:MAG: hypothetical protein K2X42_10130 [Burkholderiaceae bacterium]|nr:hypothetical protein [Burkholderiaceae bacterium]MBX9716938.1 hypothetical protein [Burkholderiaceae bacterium]
MKIQLHSIHHTPANVPYWPTLMDDLCNPPPEQVARVLGKGRRTIARYNQTGFAPRVVCLAIFWLTSWGRNAVHSQAHNDAVAMAGLANSMRCERDDLKAETRHLRSKCDRLKVAIQRLRGELRAEIERPRRDRKSWSEAEIERSERRRISGPDAQIEPEWKVLLEPSQENPTLPADTDTNGADVEAMYQIAEATARNAPTQGRYLMGRKLHGEGLATTGIGWRGSQARSRHPLPDAASQVDGDPAAAVFGSMFGALVDRTGSGVEADESDVVDAPMAVPASEGLGTRESLPLADLEDARAGTPPSATALRAWKPANGLVPLKTQPRRRASAK